ncbi:Single-stranded DNA binding protein Ssb [uncultured archaeon]|nr:Single-stranded DNA binding protein Ssb [uncultured archaeon]
MLVKELRPSTPIPEISLEVVSKEEPRKYANEKGSGTVCNCAAKDEAGQEVRVTLWNEQCSQAEEGDTIKITNGWCSEFRGQIQVSAGKKGQFEVKKK